MKKIRIIIEVPEFIVSIILILALLLPVGFVYLTYKVLFKKNYDEYVSRACEDPIIQKTRSDCINRIPKVTGR